MQIYLPSNNRLLLAVSLAVAVATFFVFWGAVWNDFIDLDDLGYIVNNRNIDQLNWNTVVWAFTSYHEANWHPITMLSLALDRYLWGQSSFGVHLTNIVIHSATVFVSCYIYKQLLEEVYRRNGVRINSVILIAGAAAAALLFGLHPLRVESVAWASERKDVLCIFFIVCTLWWYLRYVKQLSASYEEACSRIRTYLTMMLMFCLALMSKPTAVTLPAVLLIIDYYPLGRFSLENSFKQLLREKSPLLLISLCSSIVTVFAQQEAIEMAPRVEVLSRFLIACKALVHYVLKMLWPVDLAPFYPHPGNVVTTSLANYLVYLGIIIIAATAAFIMFRRDHRLLLVLFVYYLITLLPMLGIIQVGGQWIADRYTYFPALGISLVWAGVAVRIAERYRYSGQKTLSYSIWFVLVCQIILYTVMTVKQNGVWRNNETLASREIDLFPHKPGAAYYSRAKYRSEHGDCERALLDIDEAMTIALRNNLRKKYADISLSRANVFVCLGRIPDAMAAVDWAIQTCSDDERPGYIAYKLNLESRIAESSSSTSGIHE